MKLLDFLSRPFRSPRAPEPEPVELTYEFLTQVREACATPAVREALIHTGLSHLEVDEFFRQVVAMRVGYGDALEAEWDHMGGNRKCPMCRHSRWSRRNHDPEAKDPTRVCHVCRHEWRPMKFFREEFILSRIALYCENGPEHRGEGDDEP